MIKVLIADDIQILRQGLKAILSMDSDIEVVATAENGQEAFQKCKVYQPDVVLMDMRMPEYDGAYGIRSIKEELSNVKVLVLTTFDDDETIAKAVESGADGYILKEMEDEKVIASVKAVYSGISVFGDGVYERMRQKMNTESSMADADQSSDIFGGYYSLLDHEEISFTERELDMLKLLADGYDNKEIAEELCLADGTVRNNLSRLLEKVQAKDRTQLAVYAVKNGLD